LIGAAGNEPATFTFWRRPTKRRRHAVSQTDSDSLQRPTRRPVIAATLAVACIFSLAPLSAARADRASIVSDAQHALSRLEASDPRAARLSSSARAILVFPSVLKAGFVFGGETGNGVLFVRGRPEGVYNMSGGSWGLQIGGQDFSYALFFMSRGSLRYLHQSGGFAAGTLPSIVVVNKGAAASADTTTITHDVYAFPFNQKGLMANLTLEGTKITRIHD
jgi:lipid-binding SYLF domain-containing protein